MKHLESKIQSDIVHYLSKKGIFFFAVLNELAGKNARAMGYAITMGLRSGVSDLVLLLPGRTIFVEVKTPSGRQSENQRRFQERVQELGCEYYIVRSVEDVHAILR